MSEPPREGGPNGGPAVPGASGHFIHEIGGRGLTGGIRRSDRKDRSRPTAAQDSSPRWVLRGSARAGRCRHGLPAGRPVSPAWRCRQPAAPPAVAESKVASTRDGCPWADTRFAGLPALLPRRQDLSTSTPFRRWPGACTAAVAFLPRDTTHTER